MVRFKPIEQSASSMNEYYTSQVETETNGLPVKPYSNSPRKKTKRKSLLKESHQIKF